MVCERTSSILVSAVEHKIVEVKIWYNVICSNARTAQSMTLPINPYGCAPSHGDTTIDGSLKKDMTSDVNVHEAFSTIAIFAGDLLASSTWVAFFNHFCS